MAEAKLIQVPYMHAVEGESAVTFLDATFSTVDGKVKYYPDKFFGEWLYHQIFEKNKLFAEKKGLPFLGRKTHVCPQCGQELNPDLKRIMETEHRLQLLEFPPFTVKISVPSVICPKCGWVCGIDLEGRASKNLVEAMLRAFAAENIQLKPYKGK